jgi:hypothetical protein
LPQPYAEHAEHLVLYGQFVGSWDIDDELFTSGRGAVVAPGTPD